MYNGIGLTTARGSGTNGYVQRNLSTIPNRTKVEYKTEEDLQRLDSMVCKPPNEEILEHQRKRQIEIKCLEYREELEDRGLTEEEIERKLRRYRSRVAEDIDDHKRRKEKKFHEFFKDRKVPTDTHEYNQLNQEKNRAIKNAFGISKYFKEGSSLDPNRKAKEELAQSEANSKLKSNTRYELLRTPSPERESDDKTVEKALELANKSKY